MRSKSCRNILGDRIEPPWSSYAAYRELLVKDVYPTLEGLKNTLEIQLFLDPKAAKAKVDDFVDVRFVDELRKTGFIDSLYGRERTR